MTLLIFAGVLLAAMSLGMPIAFALMVSSLALMWHLDAFDAQGLALQMINGADSFPLLAIPFFMLAGEAMNAGGLSRRLVGLGMKLVGHVRGGLGYVAVIAAIFLASLSGSAVADTAALAAVLLPVMKQAGHDVPRSAGLMAAGGIIAPVIPPSIGYIVFGVAANVSITSLFLAGIVPGILMGLALAVTWAVCARNEGAAVLPRASWAERLQALKEAGLALGLPALIIGGLRFGIFTPTEAAVVAAVYALAVGMLVYRELHPRDLPKVMLAAVRTSAAVMFLVAAAAVSAYLITIADIPGEVRGLLEPFMGERILLMLAIMLLVVVVGTALDFIPTILILTPVLMPIVREAGIDPVYFGVLFIMNNAIGLLTPPVGTVLNVVCSVGRVRMGAVVRGVMPFLTAQIVVLLALVMMPWLVLGPLRWMR
ncbi:TRAP transporter large permease [Teichococcus aestuarii]|uniref:TRAP transporter large permease protein n=1 Tax=Teichococcus aestuarii TaxID=568898 RepID=A0A2U1V3M8_9PROT|nr:TRAP transporter large permease subunit [Pseudoroseomonas aestuarii]PWC28517.1 L-dehydroascorbate transporter large permease subunit [Pseudoroseomonas aestuarii]